MASTEASSSSEPKFLTGEQIAEANENGKLYIVVHGKVVDLSSYRNDHPYVLEDNLLSISMLEDMRACLSPGAIY